MSARDAIAKALAEYWEVPDQTDGYELAAEDVEKELVASGYLILSLDEVRGIRDEALEEAAKRAHECFGDPQAEADPDYVPAAIRSLKGGRDVT